jgi:hypothetical protein
MKDENGNVSIGEWADDLINGLQAFADWWNESREKNNASFPEMLSTKEWDWQFKDFLERTHRR